MHQILPCAGLHCFISRSASRWINAYVTDQPERPLTGVDLIH